MLQKVKPQFLTYLEKETQLTLLEGVSEVIIAPALLSRLGTLSLAKSCELASLARAKGLKTILEWDLLHTENQMQKVILELKNFPLDLFSCVRVQDHGVFYFVKNSWPNLPIILVLETAHHNFLSIEKMLEFGGKSVERVALSLELPKNLIEEYCKKLTVPVEVLVYGRILLFYTPRSLLSNAKTKTQKQLSNPLPDVLEMSASSCESPHRGFPVLENAHGTFMFNTKNLCLVEHLAELADCGVKFFRVDLRFDNTFMELQNFVELQKSFTEEKANLFKEKLKTYFPVTRGFYPVNKTNVLFEKLKNQNLLTQNNNNDQIGEVIDVVKGQYLAIELNNARADLCVGDYLSLTTPEGKLKTMRALKIRNLKGEEIERATPGSIVLVDHLRGISAKSLVAKEVLQ
jgi:putative protease